MAISDLHAFSDSLVALAAAAAPRVVSITDAEGGQVSGIVWRGGLVVTAHEALGGEDELSVLLPDGSTVKAELAGRDPSTDVALLKVATGDIGDWAHAPVPKVGSLAIVLGRSEHSELATLGLVAESGPAWRSMRGGEIDARLTLALRLPGRAEGGAVVAPDGSLIGMAVTGPRRRALAIPAATIARAVATLSEKGYIPRGYLGVSLHPLGDGKGAIVVGIEPKSPAETAGVAIGDIITTWNGETVGSVRDILNRLTQSAVGQSTKLGVSRGGNAIDVDVVLGERPRG